MSDAKVKSEVCQWNVTGTVEAWERLTLKTIEPDELTRVGVRYAYINPESLARKAVGEVVKLENVRARPAGQPVGPDPADQDVISGAADEPIVAPATDQCRVCCPEFENSVVAVATGQRC